MAEIIKKVDLTEYTTASHISDGHSLIFKYICLSCEALYYMQIFFSLTASKGTCRKNGFKSQQHFQWHVTQFSFYLNLPFISVSRFVLLYRWRLLVSLYLFFFFPLKLLALRPYFNPSQTDASSFPLSPLSRKHLFPFGVSPSISLPHVFTRPC